MIKCVCLCVYSQILNKVTSDLRSVDFSQSVNAANTDKNRYDDKIPCEQDKGCMVYPYL